MGLTDGFVRTLPGRILCLSILIAVLTLAIYWQVLDYGFINFDDPTYVIENNHIRDGLTIEGIKWAFTSFYASNWHPLTWLSHMLDIEFHGMNPGKHHLSNITIHTLNAVLLFILLERMTGMLWRSAMVAALFALHPLHVESVAWISERKDVLSTFFGILTLSAYVWYTRMPGLKRYSLMAVLFICSVMSKPMMVTLPFLMLVLDFWPLKRIDVMKRESGYKPVMRTLHNLLLLLREKIILFAVALISGIVTVCAQHSGGAVQSVVLLNLGDRMMNAAVSYCTYIWKMVWPTDLAVYYPYPSAFVFPYVVLCVVLIVVVTIAIIAFMDKRPYFASGWFWYMVTLLPVIGIIQVGGQSMADRYTYVPSIGIFIMAVWGVSDLLIPFRNRKVILTGISALVIGASSILTFIQAGYWRDSIILFGHALDVTNGNDLAHFNLGHALEENGNAHEAEKHYRDAVVLKAHNAAYHTALGSLLADTGRTDEAVEHLTQALQIEPALIEARVNLGNIMLLRGETEGSIQEYSKALTADPMNAETLNNLGVAYVRKGHLRNAIKCFQQAIHIRPDYKDALENFVRAGRARKSMENEAVELLRLIEIQPRNQTLYIRLGNLFLQHGELDKAQKEYKKALSIDTGNLVAMKGLAVAYSQKHEYEQALTTLRNMIKIQPENHDVHYNIACVYARQGLQEKALLWLRSAVENGFRNIQMLKNDPDLAIVRETEEYKRIVRLIDRSSTE